MKNETGSKERASTGKENASVPGIHAWLVLWKASQVIRKIAREDIGSRGIGESDFGVLEVLLHKGPLPVNEIGKRVLLTSGSMTAAINRLQRKGLVARRAHPDDRRTWMVHLTPAGRRWIEGAFAEHAQRMETAFFPLNGEERMDLMALLKKLGKGDHGAQRETQK